MGRLDRFLKLERARSGEAPAGPAAPAAPAAKARFGGAPGPPPPDESRHPSRSGATVERFDSAPEANAGRPAIRVLEDDGGASFVRCASCRADSHATATRCANCDADLTTPAQRRFSEVFWLRRREEEAAERKEVDRLRQAQARANEEAAEAWRQLPELERQLRARDRLEIRAGGVFRALGQAIGRGLARRIPSPRLRVAVFAGGGLLAGVALLLALLRMGGFGGRVLVFVVLYLGIAALHRLLRGHGVVD
jgi:hypothetical protein